MKKIAVFHFNPVELYPPAMNFLNCLQKRLGENDQVWVYTTHPTEDVELYIPSGNQITMKRIASYPMYLPAIHRLLQYLRYYMVSFLQCLRFKPSEIIYYETISSFTPYLMIQWPGRRADLFIHYHEYMTDVEYRKMLLNNLFHRLEKKIYRKAKWISHTNKYRMQLFLNDLGSPHLTNTHIFPNYPPAEWESATRDNITRPVRLIYAGALGSIEMLYIREVFEWIKSKSGEVELDIYSFKVAKEIKAYSRQLSCPFIHWRGSVAYKDLPKILTQYDIGLILYKGLSANTIYSAPNKLFEYLVCGLDVWCPEELTGTHEYISQRYWPKVLQLDFLKLDQYDLDELIERKKDHRRQIIYTCEKAGTELITKISL